MFVRRVLHWQNDSESQSYLQLATSLCLPDTDLLILLISFSESSRTSNCGVTNIDLPSEQVHEALEEIERSMQALIYNHL